MARILAVDDSPSMRQMVSVALAQAGHDVASASDGVEALKIAGAERFDLVITDVNMPNMDGITLVRELRCQANYKFTPLLVLTTEATAERKQQGTHLCRLRPLRAGVEGWGPLRRRGRGAWCSP